MDEYNGYDLFNGIQDPELQARNRAVVLWNMFEQNSQKGKVTSRGFAEMLGYIKHVPPVERAPVLSKLRTLQEGQAGTA